MISGDRTGRVPHHHLVFSFGRVRLRTPGPGQVAETNLAAKITFQASKSREDAAKAALAEASKTLRNIRSIYIENFVAAVEKDKITSYRINAKISFDLEPTRVGKQPDSSSGRRR
jgi:hypothetical protein